MLELEQAAYIILGVADIAVNIITDVLRDALEDISLWNDKLGFIIGGLIGGLILFVCILLFISLKIKRRKRIRFMVSQ